MNHYEYTAQSLSCPRCGKSMEFDYDDVNYRCGEKCGGRLSIAQVEQARIERDEAEINEQLEAWAAMRGTTLAEVLAAAAKLPPRPPKKEDGDECWW